MRLLLAAALLVATPAFAIQPAPQAADEIIEGPGDQLTLRQEVVLDTDLDTAWSMFTTGEGAATWMAPVAEVDLRPGGAIRTNYDPAAAIGDPGTTELRIVNFAPKRILTLQADLSEVEADWLTDAIRAEADSFYNVITFDALGPGRTRIVSWGTGYRDDPDYRTMLGFFVRANRWTFEQLAAAVEPTPEVDALKAMAPLVGSCWRGQFSGGAAYDIMCVETMPGSHLRSRHIVRGAASDYRGETVYFRDPEAGIARFHYYTSLGAFSDGDIMLAEDGTLLFENIRHRTAEGSILDIYGTGRFDEEGRWVATTSIYADGAWPEPSTIVMKRIDCENWDAVEAGCD
ncbi:SRPBCC domain-containing protein [Sphingomicrobium sediminis]|uniref:SRPBCC domain-containing protein n=1 Tax=Sphingomicrobium sediminis TaxID=2950949 RepID=A0A9X2EHP6_9SPHN|nr:SRPBCC domain-containing protein [Sphingomicrobium sediminis]MCM8557752.1 SRPBCC domain-containing protein [Sphingomicrobium sediminis]